MRATVFVVLFAVSAFAQNQPAQNEPTACGPASARFDTQTGAKPTLAQAENGKGQVYVIEVFDKVAGELGRPTLRVGVDGAWMGADKGNSYLAFSVDPGEHHLCASWQSRLKRLSSEAAFSGFAAEAGQNYYFRARITEHGSYAGGGTTTFSLDLDPVNVDEGKYLVASSVPSVSRLKK